MDSSVTAAIQSYGTPNMAEPTLIDDAMYRAMYEASIRDPETFWGEHGKRIDWIKPYTRVKNCSFAHPDVSIKWFEDGTLNVSSNCLDRHLKRAGDKIAIIWEADDPEQSESISYRELHGRVCQCANALKSLGVEKGDRVTIYLPMIPEIAIAMLACARIGAVHSVVFAGFSSDALGGRIADCDSAVVITADEGVRGGKRIPLKRTVDGALTVAGTECVKHVLVVRRTGDSCGHVPAARSLVRRGRDRAAKNLSRDRDGRGRPSFHPLYLRLDRPAKGRTAHHCRLPGLRRIHARGGVRFARRGHLLGDRRHRLGDRTQLHRLWPACQRRNHRHV